MIQNKRAILLFAAGLVLSVGTVWADDATPTSATAPTGGAAAASTSPKESPLKTAMKAAGALADAGKTDEAIAAYEQIGVQKSRKAESWRLNSEGLAYLQATPSQPDKAQPLFEKAAATDSANYSAWNNLGSVYEQSNVLDKAKASFMKAIKAAKAAGVSTDKYDANLQLVQSQLDKKAAKDGGAEATKVPDSGAPAAGGDATK